MSATSITQVVTGSGNIFTATGDVYNITYKLPPAEAEDRRNLLLLLTKVRQFWIEGVLDNSVHGAVLLEIGKSAQTEAVEHPWERVLELPGEVSSQIVSADKKIGDLFEDVGRSLLILGDPGSGKTITLLELARDLINRVETDPTQPVPVVFTLSSWVDKRQPLLDWLTEELAAKYHVGKKLGQSWLERNRLLLLLDGLDEVR